MLKKLQYFLWAVSIHTLSLTPTPQYVENALVPVDVEVKKRNLKKRTFAQTDIANPSVKEDVHVDGLECTNLIELIRKKFDNWAYLEPERFFRMNKECYLLNVRGAGDRWCKNSNRNHGDGEDNRIYFTLTLHGLRQKCHSNNGGVCRLKATDVPILLTPEKLPRDLMFQLFSDMTSHKDYEPYL